ncbi:hypothetical protein [Ruminococcus albus]|uniref:Conserved domain protein n=1 Tax=Ruminococcus albus 8 TaxID=246199 RepID=E9SET3_RUMAL|nr:hypothetical protein [Ruminococcus albus]EGC02199.1 conserved domain protein [Ruminococcus albus 8]MCC3351865.1 hypothetical protein [Ruminococcus albus 8]
MMNKITFTGNRKDNGNTVSGYYLCLHQTDDTDLHIIVDEHGEYHPVDPKTLTNDAVKTKKERL